MAGPKQTCVIVAEDETPIRITVVAALEDEDFVVYEASHAGEAVALLESKAAGIHLLFSDVHMPGAMSGLDLAHHTRRHWPHIALILASGYSPLAATAMPEGCRFLPKPYHLDEVVRHVRELTSVGPAG
jgi:DNA-binding NtrC family response regulator